MLQTRPVIAKTVTFKINIWDHMTSQLLEFLRLKPQDYFLCLDVCTTYLGESY